jgi:hypothetical protein
VSLDYLVNLRKLKENFFERWGSNEERGDS